MAKKVIIKDNVTGEEQYPVTSKECVIGFTELVDALNADKENLKNFKQHVEADFVKDADYNNDKGTIMGQIMNKADKSMFWVGTQAQYNAIAHDPNTIYFITE